MAVLLTISTPVLWYLIDGTYSRVSKKAFLKIILSYFPSLLGSCILTKTNPQSLNKGILFFKVGRTSHFYDEVNILFYYFNLGWEDLWLKSEFLTLCVFLIIQKRMLIMIKE